jgi:hypothetical protein
MTVAAFERLMREEEPCLAEYVVSRVCGRAAGAFDDWCTHNAPRDKYFIGSLRPASIDLDGEGETTFGHDRVLHELLTKLAPVAFGVEFRLKPEGDEFRAIVQLDWSCYYRVLPTLEEQREYQHLAVTAGDDASSPGSGDLMVASVIEEDEAEQDLERESDFGLESWLPGFPNHSGRRGHPRTDVLFPKYRKLRCSTTGYVTARKSSHIPQQWSVDLSNLQDATEREFRRIWDVILADADRLRRGPKPEGKLRVPPAALESETAYAQFKKQLTADILPKWHWALTAETRSGDEPGEIIFTLEAANGSPIDSRSPYEEGFFFDVKATLTLEGATVLPFELEAAPKSFRYDRSLWGRGFNCGLIKREGPNGQPIFETTNVPVYSQPRYTTNTEPRARFQDLAIHPSPVLRRILAAMREYDRQWIDQRVKHASGDPTWEALHGEEYDRDHALFRDEVERFERGCNLIETDPDVRLAFQLTNQSFALGGQKTAWRLFQIVFIVSQIPGIHSLKSPDQTAASDRTIVDIIYFPTGGGKTEAYLGIIVFHCFFDRLRGKRAGVTAWTRFPLRLLTLQQTQRIADVIGAAEIIRRSQTDPRLSGPDVDRFAVGYFVGQEATPNELTPPGPGHLADADWSTANDPDARQRWKKIIRCPACRTLSVTLDFDPHTVRLIHRCTNPQCKFPAGDVPVHITDNEVFRYLPAVIVGTIDKLASLGNQRKLSIILGQVTGRCVLHGYYNGKCCQKECSTPARLQPGRPQGLSGPTLFIQDELHLLKEGLGTFDSHYETFLQTLLKNFGQEVPVKIIASSATIEAFDRQSLHLYGRDARTFPGHGPTLSSSFYARTLEHPQRVFAAVLPHNKTIFNAILELLTYYHEEIQSLRKLPATVSNPYGGQVRPGSPEWRQLIDWYATSVVYFSATRELSSVRTDLESHVNVELERAGFSPLTIAELSGSTSTDDVTRLLEVLERDTAGHCRRPDTILATSMISHGVDVDRLNCIIFYGMPKQNAEYIQASSRVGRSHVGIVFACLKPARERDQSHFSYFEKYHQFLGRLVEPVAINRWSKFSIQRTIPGLFMAILLQLIANSSGQNNPNRYYMVNFVKRMISEGALGAERFLEILHEAYLIHRWPGLGAAAFREEIERRVRQFLDQIVGAGAGAEFVSDVLVPSPMRSLRDVDEQVEIGLDHNGNVWANIVQLLK